MKKLIFLLLFASTMQAGKLADAYKGTLKDKKDLIAKQISSGICTKQEAYALLATLMNYFNRLIKSTEYYDKPYVYVMDKEDLALYNELLALMKKYK